MEHRAADVADRTTRLIAATERSRRKVRPLPRGPKGEELEEALLLAAQFKAPRRGALEYPVLKRLIGARVDGRTG